MKDDPLSNIEDRKGGLDLGLMAIRIYQGALIESDNKWQAFIATVAAFRGMFGSANDVEEEKSDDKPRP